MVKFAIEDAEKDQLSRLIDEMDAGAEVILTRNGQPVARLVPPAPLPDRVPGSARGLLVLRDDFDDPLEEFADYM